MKKIKIAKCLTLMAAGAFCALAILGSKSTDNNKDTENNNTDNSESKNNDNKDQEQLILTKSENNNPTAFIKVKDLGVMEFELYPSVAPNTVNNFIYLANSGFYDNLLFYRIIKDFCIQGGSPNNLSSGKPDYSIKGEFDSNDIHNDLYHKKGISSMARLSDKNSAGSQFFITTSNCTDLDGNYAAFGRITNGIDILMNINNFETDELNDRPLKDVVIESISVDTKGLTYSLPEKI